ncbi:hypothetical protein, partial [Pseudomonas sp. K5]|uniref:hypothetical protein n=1 Tax=Pseudomonas sp. K5 TaxID=1156313 RepID=UPI001D01153D
GPIAQLRHCPRVTVEFRIIAALRWKMRQGAIVTLANLAALPYFDRFCTAAGLPRRAWHYGVAS